MEPYIPTWEPKTRSYARDDVAHKVDYVYFLKRPDGRSGSAAEGEKPLLQNTGDLPQLGRMLFDNLLGKESKAISVLLDRLKWNDFFALLVNPPRLKGRSPSTVPSSGISQPISIFDHNKLLFAQVDYQIVAEIRIDSELEETGGRVGLAMIFADQEFQPYLHQSKSTADSRQ